MDSKVVEETQAQNLENRYNWAHGRENYWDKLDGEYSPGLIKYKHLDHLVVYPLMIHYNMFRLLS